MLKNMILFLIHSFKVPFGQIACSCSLCAHSIGLLGVRKVLFRKNLDLKLNTIFLLFFCFKHQSNVT